MFPGRIVPRRRGLDGPLITMTAGGHLLSSTQLAEGYNQDSGGAIGSYSGFGSLSAQPGSPAIVTEMLRREESGVVDWWLAISDTTIAGVRAVADRYKGIKFRDVYYDFPPRFHDVFSETSTKHILSWRWTSAPNPDFKQGGTFQFIGK